MKMRSTQSRKRVKGGTPLQGAGAAPLLGSGAKPLGSPSQFRPVLNRRNHVDAALVTAALELGGQPVGRNHLR